MHWNQFGFKAEDLRLGKKKLFQLLAFNLAIMKVNKYKSFLKSNTKNFCLECILKKYYYSDKTIQSGTSTNVRLPSFSDLFV